jgi:hypothetical protein
MCTALGTRIGKGMIGLLVAGLLFGFGPAAFADDINLGAGYGYAVLGLTGSTDQLSSGGLNIGGNVGVASGATVAMSSGTVSGLIQTAALSSVTLSGGTTFVDGSACSSAATCAGVSVIPGQLASAQSAATALASSAATAAMSPTQSFTSITSPMTITGNPGQNVIDVTGAAGIHLSGGALTISGNSSETFIFDVMGANGIQLSGGASIALSPGVNPDQVLFYVPGSASNIVQTSGNANTAGIFLVPQGGIQINGGTHNSEFIGGGPISFQSNPADTQIPSPVPEPATFSLWALGSAVVFFCRRRRGRDEA